MHLLLSSTRLGFVSALFIFMACPSGSSAGQAPVSSQATWEKLVQAAEKEGEVRVYATNSVGNLPIIWQTFQKRFPKIKLTPVTPGRGNEVILLLSSERRAGKYLADVLLANPRAVYRDFHGKAKVLAPLPPILVHPEVRASHWWQGKHWYNDEEGAHVFIYESSIFGPNLYYNTKLVDPKEIKSTWDVLQPKWKGKMLAFDIVGSGQTGSTALTLLYHNPDVGPKFLERLYGEMDTTLFRNLQQGTDWLAAGKFSFCLLCRDVQRAAEQGLPVAELDPYQLKEKVGIGAGSGALGMLKDAPHPNAAAVFINWYLSREGQIAYKQANMDEDDRASLREDLPAELVAPAARRRKGVEYIFINRPEWVDFQPISDLIRKATGK
ncbi:MAG: extracellular solute-binding protein [Deltaproteobacteria bacterium]|nr:extracellular solute-binding protein [Deltaproteobacteria bacterium]